jgi:hypothetical protein
MTAKTVTLTLTVSEVDSIRHALVDSACAWHQHWRDASEGVRTDLNAESCRQINRRQWRLYNEIGDQIGA